MPVIVGFAYLYLNISKLIILIYNLISTPDLITHDHTVKATYAFFFSKVKTNANVTCQQDKRGVR